MAQDITVKDRRHYNKEIKLLKDRVKILEKTIKRLNKYLGWNK
jgi:hypothetical protein